MNFREKLEIMSRAVKNSVRKLRVCLKQFPEAVCDITTLYLHNLRLPGIAWVCGKAGGYPHFWLYDTKENMFIDFTGHQFPSLRDKTITILDQEVIVGTPRQFHAWGYVQWRRKNQIKECQRVLDMALEELREVP